MPDWKHHIIFGLIFVFGIILFNQYYFKFLNLPTWKDILWFIPMIVFMSVSPDLDHQASKVREVITIFVIIATIFVLLVKGSVNLGVILLVMLAAVWILPNFEKWGHRGHMHSISFIAVLSVPLFFIGGLVIVIIGFLAGLSHLLADREIKLY